MGTFSDSPCKSGVDSLLYRDSHLLPRTDFNCEIDPLGKRPSWPVDALLLKNE